MRKTEHYQLNLWDAEDAILREDFNADNEKIEAALAAIAADGVKIASGSYTGNDKYGVNYTSLELPFLPKLLIVQDSQFPEHRMIYPVGAASTLVYNYNDSAIQASFVVEGTTIKWNGPSSAKYQLNSSVRTYFWVAIG